MNKFIRTLIAAAMLIPGLSFAGMHIPGYVYVVPNNYMQGTMSVRWNGIAAAGQYIGIGGFAGSDISFTGADAEDEGFYCYVPTSSSLYAEAVAIKNNLQDGGFLYVSVNPANSQCTSVYLGNFSYLQQ